jgi:hypothetical protein
MKKNPQANGEIAVGREWMSACRQCRCVWPGLPLDANISS